MQPADYLLGRKAFEIWAPYWPEHTDYWPGINDGTKYVMSKTMKESDWKNTVFLESQADIEKLKNSNGSDVQVCGSGELIQLLLKNDLMDELWLKIHPLTLGKGKKLFSNGTIAAAFTLIESCVFHQVKLLLPITSGLGKSRQVLLDPKEVNNMRKNNCFVRG